MSCLPDGTSVPLIGQAAWAAVFTAIRRPRLSVITIHGQRPPDDGGIRISPVA